ncbi:putative uncharacterized protein [Porphyromonas sp. CAG:1061]|uniref:ParA family protein n=1 Tax=Porphyromonas sp. CAG:1061 TaxID=1262916 RepID=UPI00033B0AEF|nr:ParA family protein [Porphyromonas sp. CAG:1061]CCY08639.1 putative uncharacterized protein [Porphyromonas sp. CAG:1061]
MLITFANQKGGVGKSSLALLFANWLSSIGEKVLVIDLDRQGTIYYQRERDKSLMDNQSFNYEVIHYEIDTPTQEIIDTLNQLKIDNKDAFILIDAPGNLSENGLVPFLVLADCIICPFQYERKSLDSTGTFIVVLQNLLRHYKTAPKQIFIPNRIRLGLGKKDEKEIFAQTEEIFKQYGDVAPFIKELQCLARVNSISINREQEKAVEESFKWIKDNI